MRIPARKNCGFPPGRACPGYFFVVVTLGETSGRCFAVETRQVVAGFVHHLHDLVETDHMRTVGERGVGVGVEGSGRGDRVAFDAGGPAQVRRRGRRSIPDGVRVPSPRRIRSAQACRRTTGRPRRQPWRRPRRPHPDSRLRRPKSKRWSWRRCRRVPPWPAPAGCGCAGSCANWPDGRAPAGTTPHEPHVGAVTTVPPEAFSSEVASA